MKTRGRTVGHSRAGRRLVPGIALATAVVVVSLVAMLFPAPASTAATNFTGGAGLYAIWYGKTVPDLPYIKGGQVIVQWADVEPSQGKYDFSRIGDRLAALAADGLKATVQINGNNKPAWLYKKVPYHPNKLSHQVKNNQGTLMYWHKAHLDAYKKLLAAYADYLQKSPYRSSVLGVRMNFNAIGTEKKYVPAADQALNQWIVPNGVAPGVAYTRARADDYVAQVFEAHVTEFGGDPIVLVRNNIPRDLRTKFAKWFNNGDLGWFHTSSEAEPRARSTEGQYQTFYDFARSGKTIAYAESWADAWGVHGEKVDDRWCDPPKWNYWRLLFDLHTGVSAIAIYGRDLRVVSGETHGPEFKRQFNAAFEFAARYAGHHANPTRSPGAWVAFRENNVVLAANGKSVSARTLATFTGDYDFLMKRLPDRSTGDGLYNVGPKDHRFGAWARRLPAGETMRLELDETFARSLDNGGAQVKVTFLDQGVGTITIEGSGQSLRHALKNTGKWKTAVLDVGSAAFVADPAGGHIIIEGSGALMLHMVEVVRGPAGPGDLAAPAAPTWR